jgi:hypothetical protein
MTVLINDRVFYYIQVKIGKYTDGNDCLWVGEYENTYNLEDAKIFTREEAMVIKGVSHRSDFEAHPVHQIDKLVQLHVSVKKIRKPKEIPDGELCYLLSKRDTCGTNAAFWAWNHLGYVSDIRNAQIFKYKKDSDRYNREFEYYVPIEKVKKLVKKRIDIQDLRADRNITHVLTTDYFKDRITSETV